MRKIKKTFVRLLVLLIYLWGIIWYDKEYLTGYLFSKNNFSIGWKWILRYWFPQKILGYARNIPFPLPRNVLISNPNNLIFDVEDMTEIHSSGCYFQGINAKITIGKGTKIAPNCGFITTNHDINDLNKHVDGKNILLGKNCWIGMNSVILPGVELGDNTIVGAGSIVTKSFKEGKVVIAGNPAKVIKEIKNK